MIADGHTNVGDSMKAKLIRTVAGCMAAAVLLSMRILAEPSVSARHAILLDGTTGRVLYEKDCHSAALIASTTKIMTGLLIAEACDLDAKICVPAEAVGVEGSSVHLKENELLSVRTLLYGLMLHSGNDAAVALAMHAAGSVEGFAQKMNLRAEELGLKDTHYANPHGLDEEGHYSSAYDLGRLTAAAMENDVFRQVVSTKTITLEDRTFTNHNKMLWRYEGAVGVKTGYTMSAGRVLVSAAERDGRRLICVTIYDKNDWIDHARLLDFGFSSYSLQTLAHNGQVIGAVSVLNGAEEFAQAITSEEVAYSIAQNESVELQANLPAFVYAPILAGDQAGTLSVLVNDVEVKRVPLCWRYSVFEEG